MSPKTLPTAPSTLESPEILASLSPDILLANLRTAVERATTDADRTKFWALVAKLEAELARRSDTTVEGAKGAVADLKSIMNADDHSLAKRATDIATQAGDKIAPLAGATAREVKDAAGKALEAAKTGDLSEVKKLAEGVRETIAANGDKVLEYTGAAALSKMLEPIQKEWFAGIGAALSNLWKLIAGIFSGKGFSMSEVIASGTGGVGEKAGQVKDAAKDALNKGKESAEKTWDILANPVERERVINESLPGMVSKIQKEFYGETGKLNPEQIAKLKTLMQEASLGQDTVAKIKARLEDPNNKTLFALGDLSDLFMEILFGNVKTLMHLVGHGIVPAHRLWVTMVEKSAHSYQFNVSLVFQKLGLPNPPVIGLDSKELESFLAQESQRNPELAHTMLVQMYRVNGFAAAALGGFSAGVLSLTNALLVDTSTKVDGLKLWNSLRLNQFESVIEGLARMEGAILGNGSKLGTARLAEMKSYFEILKENFNVVAEIKATDPKNIAAITALRAKIRVIQDPTTLAKIPGLVLGSSGGIAYELEETMSKLSKFQHALAQGDIWNRSKQIFGSMQLLKMPRMADKLLLHFPTLESAQSTFRQVTAYGPEFASSFFRAIPVAGLVIAGVNVGSTDAGYSKKMGDFLTDAAAVMLPFVGPVHMLVSPTTGLKVNYSAEGGMEFENLGTGLLSLGMLGVDTVLLAKALQNGESITKFMTSRITDVAKLTGSLSRYGIAATRATGKLAPQALKALPLISKLPTKIKVVAILALTLGGSAYAYAKSHEDIEKKLVEDWFWDPVKQDITPKLKTAFASMDTEKKRLFIGALYTYFVERLEPKAPNSDSHFIDGVYSLVVDKKDQVWSLWTILHAHDAHFGEELRRLWVSIAVTSRDEQASEAAELAASKSDTPKTKSPTA